MRFSVSSGIRISLRTLSQNEKHPYWAFLAGLCSVRTATVAVGLLRINSIMKKLYTIIFGLVLFFGLVEPVFAVDTPYDFEFATNATRLEHAREDVLTGTPWYIWWDDSEICDTGNATIVVTYATGTPVYYPTPQQCNESGTAGIRGGISLLNALSGQPSGTYLIRLTASSTPSVTWTDAFVWTGSSLDEPDEDLDRTRFVLITSPEDEEVIATSTAVTFSSYIYASQRDIGEEISSSDWYVELTVRYNADDQLAIANRALTEKTIIVPYDFVATYNEVSTTTMAFDIGSTIPREGRYTITWKLRRPTWTATLTSFFGLDAYFNAGVLAVDTSHFVIGSLTPYDEYMTSIEEGIATSFASTTLATLSQRLGTCNPLGGNFSMLDCVIGLFTLDTQSSSTLVEQFRTMIATRAPLGYVTRVVDIFTAETATSSLPVISYTFATSSPLGAETIEFDMQEIFTDADSLMRVDLVSEKTGDNLWEIIMPFINALLYAILFYKIYKDITGINHQKIR